MLQISLKLIAKPYSFLMRYSPLMLRALANGMKKMDTQSTINRLGVSVTRTHGGKKTWVEINLSLVHNKRHIQLSASHMNKINTNK